jgi:hypothetical protein
MGVLRGILGNPILRQHVEKKASNKSGWWFFALPLWKMME